MWISNFTRNIYGRRRRIGEYCDNLSFRPLRLVSNKPSSYTQHNSYAYGFKKKRLWRWNFKGLRRGDGAWRWKAVTTPGSIGLIWSGKSPRSWPWVCERKSISSDRRTVRTVSNDGRVFNGWKLNHTSIPPPHIIGFCTPTNVFFVHVQL